VRLTDFGVLTFDCYGTLIDWETGLYEALQPLLARAGRTIGRDEALETFARFETAQERETPSMLYPELLAAVHRRLAREWGLPESAPDARAFGASIPDWPAFHDSAGALRYLERHYQLVVLSNVDRRSFAASNERLGVDFTAVYTAEDIGSYKPDPRNFAYMLEHLAARGIPPSQILHTAQSLHHDHVPARAAGLARAWIDRRQGTGWGATAPPPDDIPVDFRFPDMAAMVEAHREETAAEP